MGYVLRKKTPVEKQKAKPLDSQEQDPYFLGARAPQQGYPDSFAPEEPETEGDRNDIFKQLADYTTNRLKQVGKSAITGTVGLPGNLLNLGAMGLETSGIISPESAQSVNRRVPTSSQLEELLGLQPGNETVDKYINSAVSAGVPAAGLTAATGGAALPALLSGLASGTAGQAVEEAGGPWWLRFLTELGVGGAAHRGAAKTSVTSKAPETQKMLNRLENLGVSEKSRLLHKRAAEGSTGIAKTAGETGKARAAFETAIGETEKALDTYTKQKIPGLARGEAFLKEDINNVFRALDAPAERLLIRKTMPLIKSLEHVKEKVSTGISKNETQKNLIKLITDKQENLLYGVNSKGLPLTGKDLIDEIRTINSEFKTWDDKAQKAYVMRSLKDGLKKTIAIHGTEGKQLAKQVDRSHVIYIDYLNKMEVLDDLKKFGLGGEKFNFKGLDKSLNNPDTAELFTKALGKNSVEDLRSISRGAENVKKLQQVLQSSATKSILEKSALTSAGGALLSLLSTGDIHITPLAALPYAGMQASKYFATQMLTEPKYQHVTANAIKAILSGSPPAIADALKKFDEITKESREATEKAATPAKKGYVLRRKSATSQPHSTETQPK